MKDLSLVIMAAGLGSRFGGGIKQLEPIGPMGQIIMDYSIHDALEAGFNKVVFIIRKDLEKDFKEIIGHRIEKLCKVEYAFQEIENIPNGFTVPEGRMKPWGTGHAILSTRGVVNEPFVVINADDYYGKEAFKLIHDFLIENYDNETAYAMAGFVLKNTLSENGGVSRGVVKVDENSYMLEVEETHNIVKTATGAGVKTSDDCIVPIDENKNVSMNLWGLSKSFLDILENNFSDFLSNIGDNQLRAEFLLPLIVDGLVKNKKATVKVLETKDTWFGVTYKEDKESVVNSFKKLIADGVYTPELY